MKLVQIIQRIFDQRPNSRLNDVWKMSGNWTNNVKAAQKLRFCWRFYLCFKVLCIWTSDIGPLKYSTLPFWSVWRILCIVNSQNCFPTIHGCYMKKCAVPTSSDNSGYYLTEHHVDIIEKSLLSPDLALCFFFLFPKLKSALRGKRLESLEAMKDNTTKKLKAIPSSASKKCMHVCVALDDCHIEGNKKIYLKIKPIFFYWRISGIFWS